MFLSLQQGITLLLINLDGNKPFKSTFQLKMLPEMELWQFNNKKHEEQSFLGCLDVHFSEIYFL